MTMNIFGSRVESKLPNLHFRPGVVSLRKCGDCGDFDRRTWYATAEQASQRESSRLTSWCCPSCSGVTATLVRAWFDNVYA